MAGNNGEHPPSIMLELRDLAENLRLNFDGSAFLLSELSGRDVA